MRRSGEGVIRTALGGCPYDHQGTKRVSEAVVGLERGSEEQRISKKRHKTCNRVRQTRWVSVNAVDPRVPFANRCRVRWKWFRRGLSGADVSVSVWMTKMPGQLPSTLIHRNNVGLEVFWGRSVYLPSCIWARAERTVTIYPLRPRRVTLSTPTPYLSKECAKTRAKERGVYTALMVENCGGVNIEYG